MSKPSLKGTSGFKQGKYTPINPDKYIGKVTDIVFRSSWEQKFMYYLDMNRGVIRWNSEDVVIPYFWEVDGKMHKYYMDFYFEAMNSKGELIKYIIEIKPKKDTEVTKPKRLTEKAKARYANNILTVSKNEAKWKAAEEFAKQKGLVFKILTEDDLF